MLSLHHRLNHGPVAAGTTLPDPQNIPFYNYAVFYVK